MNGRRCGHFLAPRRRKIEHPFDSPFFESTMREAGEVVGGQDAKISIRFRTRAFGDANGLVIAGYSLKNVFSTLGRPSSRTKNKIECNIEVWLVMLKHKTKREKGVEIKHKVYLGSDNLLECKQDEKGQKFKFRGNCANR